MMAQRGGTSFPRVHGSSAPRLPDGPSHIRVKQALGLPEVHQRPQPSLQPSGGNPSRRVSTNPGRFRLVGGGSQRACVRPAQRAHPRSRGRPSRGRAGPRLSTGLSHRSKRDAADCYGEHGCNDNAGSRASHRQRAVEDASTLRRRGSGQARWLRRGHIAIVRP
jgi:hypothetical protein